MRSAALGPDVAPAAPAKTDENDKRVLSARRELGFYEEEYQDASSNMRQWLVNKLPILDAEGEIENIVTVALDIGDRKRSRRGNAQGARCRGSRRCATCAKRRTR